MTATQKGRVQAGAASSSAIRAPRADHNGNDVPRVLATSYPPSGRRRLPLLVVYPCPFDGQAHAHRGGSGLRDAGCGHGRSYYLVPREAMPRHVMPARRKTA
jgi:hypothetical protein